MNLEDLQNRLAAEFPKENLRYSSLDADGIHYEADPAAIVEIANYVNLVLGFPLACLFANDERSLSGVFAVYYVFADTSGGSLVVFRTPVSPDRAEIPSISGTVHAAALYEREIQDLFGIRPVGHPDAKRLVFHGNWPEGEYPLRKDYDRRRRPEPAHRETSFQKVTGTGVFEIPVGPVHAGIIEPGHFRFSVAGEPIINLEAQLYFVHKGIEKLCEGQGIERCLYVSERISGDETFANSLAYCQAVEKIASATVPERAEYTRLVFAEHERLTSHLGDLAGICLDTAYGFAAFQFRMMRGWAYLLADELCGMRFLRSVNRPGGVRKDFLSGKESSALRQLAKIRSELEDTAEIIRSNSLFIDRVENTGILRSEIAVDLHAVGPGGRASGVNCDVRKLFPYGAYRTLDFPAKEHRNGDVNSRMNVKIEECLSSIGLMTAAIEAMPAGDIGVPIYRVPAYGSAFGLVEAPRGENLHWVMTGEHDTVFRYKVRTPSFCNWPALTHAVRGNIVPDFPLINKSFNLSYAGNDL